jgi:hypothetical protein
MDSLARYIVRNYAPLMTPIEEAAHMRLVLTHRATHGDTSPEAQERVTSSPVNQRQYPDACTNDPTMLALAAAGLELFVARVAHRIQRDHGSELTITRCPQCKELLDAPTSTQCVACRSGAAEAEATA